MCALVNVNVRSCYTITTMGLESTSGESSDSDYRDVDENDLPLDKTLIKSLLAKNPEFLQKSKNKSSTLKEMKAKLAKIKPKTRHSERKATTKDNVDLMREMKGEIEICTKNVETLASCLVLAIDRIENLESQLENQKTIDRATRNEQASPEVANELKSISSRVEKLEKIPRSYANVAGESSTSNPPQINRQTDSDRINRLEFATSEEERKKRLLEVSVTHPNIDTNAQNLTEHVRNFFQSVLKLPTRELDNSIQVKKSNRNNTVMVSFSHRRYKGFMYRAKKSLKEANCSDYEGLYINDNLTTYNFKMLMELKDNRKRYTAAEDPFISTYTHDGRIFVKLKEFAVREGVHVKNHTQLREIICKLPTPSANQASETPSPQRRV